MNFYSLSEGAFEGDAQTLASAFAEQAAVVISNARAYWDARALGDQLAQALESRVVIEQAKGLLMSTGLTADAAFDALRRASQRENRKLSQVAADVVAEAERRATATGEDPAAS